jgi:hypothetical protein
MVTQTLELRSGGNFVQANADLRVSRSILPNKKRQKAKHSRGDIPDRQRASLTRVNKSCLADPVIEFRDPGASILGERGTRLEQRDLPTSSGEQRKAESKFQGLDLTT